MWTKSEIRHKKKEPTKLDGDAKKKTFTTVSVKP